MQKILLFDWGNTLMRVFPGMEGRMADWPAVEAMPGVVDALTSIQDRCLLGIATNAQDSTTEDVRSALSRVGLDQFISFIYTARELGLVKTNPLFFPTILSRLQAQYPNKPITLDDLVMIGDDLTSDILNAKNSKLKAIWYIQAGQERLSLPPLHDGEITHFSQLEHELNRLTLPDVPTCLEWLSEQALLPNIVAHSQTVASAAYLLSVWLRQSGLDNNPILAHRGGLLHDLDKLSSRKLDRPHGIYSAELLILKGQPELAEIARRHIINHILDPMLAPRTWEEKCVYFADKLTEGSQVGPVITRLEALCQRYPDYADGMRSCRQPLQAMENDICNRLNLTPEELIAKLIEKINPLS